MSVAAVSPSDVWAVGQALRGTGYTPIFEHWDGTAWSYVPPAPPLLRGSPSLVAVAAAPAGDVWAVGSFMPPLAAAGRPLIERWDGTAWTLSPSPRIDGGYLTGVTIVAADDVWAVGGHFDGTTTESLIEHWNGSRWRVVESPPAQGLLGAVDAAGAFDAWAVGPDAVEHWDGKTWTAVDATGPTVSLRDVSITSRRKILAAGYRIVNGKFRPLIERWSGTAMLPVGSVVHRDKQSDGLQGIDATSGSNIWVVGDYFKSDGLVTSLIEQWDGSNWDTVSSPKLHQAGNDGGLGEANSLVDVSVLPSGEAWAVGTYIRAGRHQTLIGQLCPVKVQDTGFAPAQATVEPGETAVWFFGPGNAALHSVVDGSGLGLFDSGPKQPGASFTYRYISAGFYPVLDGVTSSTAGIDVPVKVGPVTGVATTGFDIVWASEPAPAGFVYDVQIERPGSTTFVDWKAGVTEERALFTPDEGIGVYAFQGRIRSLAGGTASGWSPPTSITVG
jgi:hypothetical protein